MAESLNLEENYFLNQFGEEALLKARFNYYSCYHRPDLVLGLKPHADGTGDTIILQDNAEGLQVFKDGKWYMVPTIPNAFLVLMCDQMQIMTNGVFKSPMHRVYTERERLSVVMFYTPEPDKEIGPKDDLVIEAQPRLFKKVKNYSDIHKGYYQRGLRTLHEAEV